MARIATSIEEANRLLKLGVDIEKADMWWESGVCGPELIVGNYSLHIQGRATDNDYKKLTNKVLSPAFSLSALIDMMPYWIVVKDNNCEHYMCRRIYNNEISYHEHDGLHRIFSSYDMVSVAVDIICTLISEGHIQTL